MVIMPESCDFLMNMRPLHQAKGNTAQGDTYLVIFQVKVSVHSTQTAFLLQSVNTV